MRHFAALYDRLESTTRASERVAALIDYFNAADAADAAWALALLTGRRLKRGITPSDLRDAAAEAAGIERWLLDACVKETGNLAEAVALLLPADFGGSPASGTRESLSVLIEQRILPLPRLDARGKRAALFDAWATMNPSQRLVFHKILHGPIRLGLQTNQIIKALAAVAGTEEPIMAHRLSGYWNPAADDFIGLLTGQAHQESLTARPYPFFVASPLPADTTAAIEQLGDAEDWIAEWKRDGLRAQLLIREGTTLLWTKGNELITPAFPEIASAAHELPPGTVIDGELLAWEQSWPLPFSALQKRLTQKSSELRLFPEVPVAFLAQDLLEYGSEDLREEPIEDRRALLAELLAASTANRAIRLSPTIEAGTWQAIIAEHQRLREHGAQSLLLKRKGSRYRAARQRGDWWEWKADPLSIDAVLVMAERGPGRRADLFTGYTLAVWDLDELVPIAKASSGLDEDTIARIDAWIRKHTLERFGPVRRVEPEHVFEIQFEGIQLSDRHRSGLKLRTPKLRRWRRDKHIDEADTIDRLRELLEAQRRSLTMGIDLQIG